MSLALKLKQFQLKERAKIKGDKVAHVEFRGVSHSSKPVSDSGGGGGVDDLIPVDEIFEWPVARPIDPGELVKISLLIRRGYLGNKVVGSYSLVLQAVVETGRLVLCDTLTDATSKPVPITVDLEVHYIAPNGPPLCSSLDDEQHLLVDVEQNIANLEQSLAEAEGRPLTRTYSSASDTDQPRKKNKKTTGFLRRSGSSSTPDTSPVHHSKRATALSSVRSLIRLGRMRSKDPGGSSGDEATRLLTDRTADTEASAPPSLAGSVTSLDSAADSVETRTSPTPDHQRRKLKPSLVSVTNAMLKSADFQICVTIIEARQLAGLNMDPVVCVQVGDHRKYTSVKESTNCPYYNEYFVFDFHMPPVMLFDKIITLSVLHSRRLMRSGTVVGSFKIDVKTVYDAPDHQFYHKWALLTDPEDIAGGPKGYLKCDLSVMGKGDTIRVPANTDKDDDDIEANLLLPVGVPVDRQRARFVVKIYRADGLPKMNSTLVASVKKAFTGESHDLVSPYVQVSFAGLSVSIDKSDQASLTLSANGKTSVKKHCYAPVWNEQLVFTEMFPPLCQRIKLQLRDSNPVNSASAVIGTHFIDLKAISNDGDKGFLPTFGPSFVYLYGSTRDYRMIDEHAGLNEGLGEGVSYRARLLIAIRTEITDNIDLLQNEVEREPTFQIQESSYGRNEELFLFGTIMEASMIDKKLGEKPILFELSLGNAGNVLDGHNETYQQCVDSDGEDNLEAVTCGETNAWQSTTPAAKPMTYDKVYFFLPYWDDKPCMHVGSVWPDHRRRMFNSNLISRIADKLEEGLSEVSSLHDGDEGAGEKRLRAVLDELSTSCGRYLSISKGVGSGPGTGKTKLDKERVKLCLREIEQLGSLSRTLKALVTHNTFRERYKTAMTYLQKLRFLEDDPQSSVPDVFVWAVSGGRRVAYHRLPARDVMYSIVEEERGRHCGKVHTIFLKLPGKRSVGPSGWAIQVKLQIYLWLGMLKHKKHFIDGLPQGYEVSHEIRNADRPKSIPPSVIHYIDRHWFELRAHMYQARSLIGSDASGLSDPFARVVTGEVSRTTQVIDETLSPTWDELLVFSDIQLWGLKEQIKLEPPAVVIEVFDRDKVGKAEFIGRTVARPHVILIGEQYSEPALEWFDLQRGPDHAGELLACFELLHYQPGVKDLPMLPPAKEDVTSDASATNTTVVPVDFGPILPVPRGIRPTLAKYRIEVLFWGLRDLKRIHLLTVDRPRVDIEVAGHILYSSVIQNARKNPNFQTPVKFLELELPEQELYRPPLTIRAVDCRSFGRFTLVGTHTINSIHKYMFVPATKRDRHMQMLNTIGDNGIKTGVPTKLPADHTSPTYTNEQTPLLKEDNAFTFPYGLSKKTNKREHKRGGNKKEKRESVDELEDDEESRDWWTKYFASIEAMIEESKDARKEQLIAQQNGSLPLTEDCAARAQHWEPADRKRLKTPTAIKSPARLSPKSARKKQDILSALIKIYTGELEAQPEYNGFKEWLLTFELTRGKKTGDDTEDETRVVGLFKGALKVYKWPLPKDVLDHTIMGFDPQYGFFQGLPSNEPMHVLVRVYIVKANDLHPMDLNGKADPYVVLQLGSKRVSDKDNYISKQLNPVFGKCFEIEATFPQDSMLTVQILDWDLVGSDEMIGETKIDLENRFYSRHRATCGVPRKYEQTGFNQWRDPMKPSQILTRLCKESKLEPPVYLPGSVRIGRQTFTVPPTDMDPAGFLKGMEEQQALAVLHRWHDMPRVGCQLVPEHIETRPLYHPTKPGIEQGKLEMWVDLFPMDMPLPGPPLDISPRKPKSYELRIVIWNTDDVVLEDDAFFTGEKMSDIYVKGWVKGPEDCQYTDIHYRSLTGEGNFNWRFIFPFEYLVAEEKIVISRKESLFSWDETECKIPARLELQVWDADHFSADDFLGAITLDLNRFPRGAKSSKLCTVDMLKTDGSVPMVNIFKQKRVKGWWPFYIKKDTDELELTGKVEAEIHLLTKEEAERNPAGCGRNEPDPLEKPNRPDASFMWFLNPIKSMRYVIWHNYKWAIIKFLCFFALFIVILLFVYAIPGYTVKRIIGA